MSDDATFEPIKQDSTERMFGPRCVLLCGLDPEEQGTVADIVSTFSDLSVTVVAEGDEKELVGSLVDRADRTGFGSSTDLPRLVLMSGLTQQELHAFMAAFRKSGLQRPLWAALTPTSATWALEALLAELEEERKAMEKAGR